MNAGVPQEPGDRGLVCRLNPRSIPKDLTVIVRLDTSKWLYLGEYETTQVRDLAPSEFEALDQPVRSLHLRVVECNV